MPRQAIGERVTVPVDSLRPHPRNYRTHPDSQIDHIAESIRLHGLYRNVVIARDGTILAGHGVVLACQRLGIDRVPVVRLDVDPESVPAVQVLTGDNEIARLGDVDDTGLAGLLEDLAAVDVAHLLGTGFTPEDLDALTRLAAYAAYGRVDADAEWTDMPEFSMENLPPGEYRVTVRFRTHADADAFFALISRPKQTLIYWPEEWDPGQRQFTGDGKPRVMSDA